MSLGRIVVAGGGWEAWLAASLLSVLLRGSMDLIVVGRAAPPPMPAVPATAEAHEAHRLLGLDAPTLAQVAVPRPGTLIEAAEPFFVPLVPFGGAGLERNFAQQWLRLRMRGRAEALAAYLPDEAPEARRTARPTPEDRPAGSGLFVEPIGYGKLLSAAARRRGVRHIAAEPVAAERDEAGSVKALLLDEGTRVAGDWFLDASEHRRLLAESLLGCRWCPEAEAKPLALAIEPTAPAAPHRHGRLVDDAGGWRWQLPLAEGAASGRLLRADPTPTWHPGSLRQAWTGNVLAIGSAQRVLHPLEPLAIERVQRAVARLVTLFPSAATLPVVAREYQRQLDADDRACATAAAALDALTGKEPREDLARIAQLFRRTGQLPAAEGDPFSTHQWLALLIGTGPLPARYDPSADLVPLDEAAAAFRRFSAAAR